MDAALAVLDDPVEQCRFTRYSFDAEGQALAESSLRLSGLHCAACAGLIEQALAQVAGVRDCSVSAGSERLSVRWHPQHTSVAAIVRAVRAAGYDATPDTALAGREQRRTEHRARVWQLFVASFCAMQVMMLATPSYVAGPGELAPDLRQLLNWASWLLSLPVMVFSAGPLLAGAARSLRARRISMDVPVALGLVVTFVASSGATFAPQGVLGDAVYFDSLTMFVSFLMAGRLLETRARHRVAQVLDRALAGLPETAMRLGVDGQVQRVSVRHLVAGDQVRVPLGSAFPADGELIEGSTQADESLLTGESQPVAKPCGSAVVAGSLNLGVPVLMRALRVGDDTRLQAIVALMQAASSQRPAVVRAADRWAAPFLIAVLVLAAAAAAAWSLIDPSRAVWVAVSVLIVTCPCALSMAVPSALLSATSALASRGVIVQRLDVLDALNKVQRVYLDKTGTLTDARLSLAGLGLSPTPPGGRVWEADTLLALAGSLAAWSSHPLCQALVAAAAALPAPVEAGDWQGVQEIPGQGLCAVDRQSRHWSLGRGAELTGAGAASPAVAAGPLADPPAAPPQPDAVMGLRCDGRLLVRFDFDETLRPDAQATVAGLRARGLEVVLLSGDHIARAQRLGQRLGVDSVIGGATPERKLAEVVAAQAAGLAVAMVGDGINDAPVLARADVSFAMGQGALVARARADAVVASGRLGDLLLAWQMAARTRRVLRQNLVWAASYNGLCIPLALAGWLPPWAAGLGMACSSLAVIGNALRLLR